MTFTYRYRAKSGNLEEATIEAKSRTDCYAQLKAKGIVPSSLVEGGKAKPAKRGAKQKPVLGRGALAGLLVVVLAVGAFVAVEFFTSKPSPAPVEKATAEPVASPPPKPVAKKPIAKPKTAMPVVKAEKRTPLPPLPEKQWQNVYTNSRGEEVRVDKDGSKIVMFKAWQQKREEAEKNPPKKIFKHSAEAYMAMFLSPGVAVPPPPREYSEDDVQAMLAAKIEVDAEKDTPDEIRQKEGVAAMKEELAQFLSDGGTFNQYLYKLKQRQEKEAAKMFEATKMINDEIKKGDMKAAKELYDAINKHLDSENMPHVNVAPKYRRMLEDGKEKEATGK